MSSAGQTSREGQRRRTSLRVLFFFSSSTFFKRRRLNGKKLVRRRYCFFSLSPLSPSLSLERKKKGRRRPRLFSFSHTLLFFPFLFLGWTKRLPVRFLFSFHDGEVRQGPHQRVVELQGSRQVRARKKNRNKRWKKRNANVRRRRPGPA